MCFMFKLNLLSKKKINKEFNQQNLARFFSLKLIIKKKNCIN